MIRLILDENVTLPVCSQREPTRTKFVAALRRLVDSPHVAEAEEHIDISRMFGNANCVPDVDRYRISIAGDQCRLERHEVREISARANRFNDRSVAANHDEGTVLVVLESPHVAEYIGGNPAHPIAPAQGKTGCKIDRRLGPLLAADANECLRQRLRHGARVVIANPVPFQTSLYCVHGGNLHHDGECLNWRTLRDAVWRTLWLGLCCADFADRVQRYCPSVILNCCTGGKKGIQRKVTRGLQQQGFCDRTFCAAHPSMWHAGTAFMPAAAP